MRLRPGKHTAEHRRRQNVNGRAAYGSRRPALFQMFTKTQTGR